MGTQRAFAALVITVAAVAASPARADDALVIRIYDLAGVKPDLVQKAKVVTDGILARAGIQAVWLVCSGGSGTPDSRCAEPIGSLDLVVRLQRGTAHAGADVCGTALRPVTADTGHFITLFVDCVQRAADTFVVPMRMALAYCLAHELGHQLLPTPSHTDIGIMSASLRGQQARLALMGRMRFSAGEASLMRAGIAARAGMTSTSCPVSSPVPCRQNGPNRTPTRIPESSHDITDPTPEWARRGGCMKTVPLRLVRLVGGATRALVTTACFALAAPVNGFAANIVVEWNATAVSTALAAGQGPVPQTRSMAIVAVAVNDAVNGISGRYVTYDLVGWRPSNASADAAAAGAAHRALTMLYPTQGAALDAAFAASLAAHAISASDAGIAFGEMVADEIVAARSNDGSALAQFP